jgi:hypothetical protein
MLMHVDVGQRGRKPLLMWIFANVGAQDVGAQDVGAQDVGAQDVGAQDVGAQDVGAQDADFCRYQLSQL